MIRFVLSGYFGFDNTGDEAILKSMIYALQKQFSMVEIVVLSNNPEKTAAEYGVKAVNRWSFREVFDAMKDADCLLSGGGSLLQDVTGIKSLGYYLAIVRLAKFLRKPVFFYAQGIGPVTTPFGRFLVKSVVNKVDFITVRDKQSETALREMGVYRPKIVVTGDPVLNMPPCKDAQASKMVCVSVRDWEHASKLQKALAEVCDDFADDGYKVVFLPFQYPQDVEPCQAIMARMRNKALLPENQLSLDDISCAMAYSEVVIGMRYHALVLAAINNVPFVGIEYDPKVTNFLKQCGMPSAGKPENITAQSIRNALRLIYTDKGRKEKFREKMLQLSQNAERTIELLADFMNGEK